MTRSSSDFWGCGFPGGSDGKESSCNAAAPGSVPEQGRSPGGGNGYPLQYSCWRIPWTEEAGGLQSIGSQRACLFFHSSRGQDSKNVSFKISVSRATFFLEALGENLFLSFSASRCCLYPWFMGPLKQGGYCDLCFPLHISFFILTFLPPSQDPVVTFWPN